MINPTTKEPFTVADASRLLGLADSFMEDWEENEGKGDPECAERRTEYDAIRPLLAEAPALYAALQRMVHMHTAMMGKVNHGASWYDGDTLREMNEAPIQAARALDAAEAS